MLEIRVFDEIYITDSLGETLAVVSRVIEKILAEDSDVPVNILISKPRANSPPALGINVSEVIEIKDKLV
jgi:hypothetical protein